MLINGHVATDNGYNFLKTLHDKHELVEVGEE